MILPKSKYRRVHFVGIGGSGMSGIAEVLHNMGFEVSGSDIARKDTTERLERLGVKVFYGHSPENVRGAQLVVLSSAITEDNPEVQEARRLGIPVIPRAEMLAELMRVKFSIAVSGAHGKTTTTSMIAQVLAEAGLDPTVVIGGRLKGFGTGARLGQSEYLVAEADESDKSFLKLLPTIAVITNIDREHMEAYGSLLALKRAFADFASRVPFYGAAVVNLDDPNVQEILPEIRRRVITYGLSRQADFSARAVVLEGLGSRFEVYSGERKLTEVSLRVPGAHNVLNALAAFAVSQELGVSPEVAARALGEFSGVERRFEIKGERDGVVVVDDYGHHPTEIAATLEAARAWWQGRIVVVFQPHRYTRTRDLWRDFGPVFHQADELIILPIYPAGEKPIPGVSAELILEAVRASGHRAARLVSGKEEALEELKRVLKPGDMLLTLGAGDVWKVGEAYLGGN